ncbi:MAG: transposase [Rhodospirillaceae bacterium]|nr:transposase [Rhodospirillaceae bacterium]
MGEVVTIGLDIAKSVFQVHGVDDADAVVIRKRVSRAKLLEFFAGLKPCLVGIEACPAAHHWGRELQALGHAVKLMPPSYVKAYLKRSKNDANDAAAICEAVTRPTMRFVPIKTKEQQAALLLHRARQLLVRQRTMLSNAIRGHLAELGIVSAKGRNGTGVLLEIIADVEDSRVPPVARGILDVLARSSTAPWEPRSDRSTGVSWLGTVRARRAGGWKRFQVSGRSSPLPSLPRSATGRRSDRDAAWLPGLGWCRSSTRPAARTSSAASPSRATDTCDGCWLSARWPLSATRKSTAR